MKLLFIHQNFPGQFKHLAPALAAQGHEVMALTLPRKPMVVLPGVKVAHYRISRSSSPSVHPWLLDFETKVIRGEACFEAALALKRRGFRPDVIVAHPGWGESMFLKEVWPDSKLGLYAEFHYLEKGGDTGFDPEFTKDDLAQPCRLKLKNLNSDLQFRMADAALSPTLWQASTYPDEVRHRITVAHDGIDTQWIQPRADVRLTIDESLQLSRQDEVITYFARNLEPYRGYHIFIRALPEILKRRPKARVLVVGDQGTSYGRKPDPQKDGGHSWKDIFISEVRGQISDEDWARVHFLGTVPHPTLVQIMQLSRVHLYWTYPFVLSWSLLEAMSAGCCILASDTGPVREVIRPGQTGVLVDFFDVKGLVTQLEALLDDAPLRARLGAGARALAVAEYDLQTCCLPKQLRWVQALAES
jgi:glycosyltransferase involved in cell wall biosynthesis